MKSADVYRITPELDQSTLDAVVTRLEARGKHPRFMEMMNEYLDAMKIDSCGTVLDLGCGTGVVTRAIAQRSGFSGRVSGIDLSPYFIASAKAFSEQESVAEGVEFLVGDSHSLKLPDGAFDAVIAHTLVSHVTDPVAVLSEMARIVKPGGSIAVFDGDFASLTFGNDDAEQGKAIEELIIAAIVTNARVMRQMPQLLQETDLRLDASFSYVVADIGKADFWTPALQAFRRLLPQSGVITEDEANAWVDLMLVRSGQNKFFGASNFYCYIARR